jgi:hypothetical protein
MAWFDDFKAESARGGDGAEPPDGQLTALLVAAKVGQSRAGDPMVILEWQTANYQHYWTSFHRVSGKAAYFTRQTLTALGIDLEALGGEDALDEALADLTDSPFVLDVERRGDFLNTSVVRPAGPGQTAAQADLPVSSEDFSPPQPASIFDDDDIPF